MVRVRSLGRLISLAMNPLDEKAFPAVPADHPPQGPFDVFLSYARLDNNPVDPKLGWVTALHEFIQSQTRLPGATPPRVFFDTTNIRDYEDWRHKILAALRQSKLLLVCLSPNYFRSNNCRWEWEHFLRRQGPHERGEGETIQSVRFVELPTSIDEQHRDWLESVRRGNTIDLQPWFAQGPVALQRDPQARAAAQRLVDALLQRIKLARRELAREYGNLRAANEHFVGRRKQLRDLHEMVGVGTLGVITAVHGLGGIGKTELALQYANDYARSFPGGIWWINAANQRDLRNCLATLIDDPRFPQPPERSTDDEQRYAWVLYALNEAARQRREQDPEGGGQVLILLDNVDHPELLGANQRVHVTNSPWLSLLATTRESAAAWSNADRLAVLPLDALDPEDALALIREWQPNHAFASTDEEAAAKELCSLLGGFTLAVEQAAIHLGTQAGTSVRGFLEALKAGGLQQLDELARNPELQANMQHREKQLDLVLAQTLPEAGSLARVLLDYAACWAPDAVPKPWIDELVREHHPELLQTMGLDGDPLAAAWAWLARRRLLTDGALPELARMHRLVRVHLDANDAESRQVTAQIETRQGAIEREMYLRPIHAWRIEALQAWATFDLPAGGRLRAMTLSVIATYTTFARSVSAAASLATASLDICEALARADNKGAQSKRDLSVSLNNVGQIMAAEGDAAGALDAYQRSLQIREALALTDNSSEQAQRDLSISLDNVGRIKAEQGDASGALTAFQRSRDICEILALPDKSGAQAKRDLAVSLANVGQIQAAQGDAAGALAAYQRSLQIFEALAPTANSSAQAKRDVSVSLDNLGQIKFTQGDAAGALTAFQRSLEICEALALTDNNSAQAKRDLSVSLDNVGQMRAAQGDAEEALAAYQRGLQIREALAQADPRSALAKRDLSISLDNVGQVKAAQGDAAGALAACQRGMEIRETLERADNSSAQARRDLSVSLNNIGQIKSAQGDTEGALAAYRRSLQIREALALIDKNNAQAKRDLVVTYFKLGQLATDRREKRHHAFEIDRIFSELDAHRAHISPEDRDLWIQIQQWLRNNP